MNSTIYVISFEQHQEITLVIAIAIAISYNIESKMGLPDGEKFLYRSKAMKDLNTLKCIIDRYHGIVGIDNDDGIPKRKGRYNLALDLSIFLYKFQGLVHSEKVKKIEELIQFFVSSNFAVTVVADPPDFRYDTKLATIQRRGKKLTEKCKEFINSKKTNGLVESLEEKKESIVEDIKDWCHKTKNVAFLMDKKAQADVLLAIGMQKGDFDIIMSSDSDFAMYLGQRSLCLYDHRFFDGKVLWFKVATPSHLAAINCVGPELLESYAKHPIFDNDLCLLPRAVIATALGTDAFPPGLRGIGVVKIYSMLQKIQDENKELQKKTEEEQTTLVLTELEKLYYESCETPQFPKNKFKAIIWHYASALAYEKSEKYGYIESPPEFLDSTLEAFKAPETKIMEVLESVKCVGSPYNDDGHDILKENDWNPCFGCKRILCEYCIVFYPQPEEGKKCISNNQKFCFWCFEKIVEKKKDQESIKLRRSIPSQKASD